MTGRSVSFADMRVDPAARELWKGDRLVDLPPHVFDFLCHLIKHRDRAVGRDELVAAVWGKTEVSDTLIGQTVMRIRRELGDDSKDQHILRTIPRFGYRWVLEIDSDHEGQSETARQDIASPRSQRESEPILQDPPQSGTLAAGPVFNRSRWFRQTGWLLLVLGLLVAAVLLMPAKTPPGPGLVKMPSSPATAAVLLADLDQVGNAEWSWLRFGVMDAVSNRLRSTGLPAVPSESVIALLGTASSQSNKQLREAAKVSLIVRPTVSESGGGWLVRLDTEDGKGLEISVDAQARDAIQAARSATDKLLKVLGHEATADLVETEPLNQFIHRLDAAILADDPETAEGLIRLAPAVQRNSPEVGLRMAKIDFRKGRSEEALKRLQNLMEQTSALAQPELRAGILNGLGSLSLRTEEQARAKAYFSEAVALLESRNDPTQLGEAYLGRAAAATELQEFDNAMADYARARVALRQANDTLALLRIDADEGLLDLQRGLPAQALPQLESASKGFEQWGALNEAIFTRIGEIEAHLSLLQINEALASAAAADRLAQRVESRTTLNSLALTKSLALAAAGQWSQARRVLNDLRDIRPPIGAITESNVAGQLAAILLDEGKPHEVLSTIDSVAEKMVLPRQAIERADAHWIKLTALVQIGDKVAAAIELEKFELWVAKTDNAHARMLAQLGRAQFGWRFGIGDYNVEFARAVQMAETSGVPADIATATAVYADILLAEGDLERASTQVGRLSRWSDKDYQCAVLEARLYAALGKDEARQAALARARSLAGERILPEDATNKPISTREAASH